MVRIIGVMMPQSITNAILAERIDGLRADVCDAVKGIQEATRGFISFQIEYERRHAEVVKELGVHQTEITANKTELSSLRDIVVAQSREIGELKDTVKTLTQTVDRILSWMNKAFWAFFVPFVLGLVSFIIGLLTHSIAITFPK